MYIAKDSANLNFEGLVLNSSMTSSDVVVDFYDANSKRMFFENRFRMPCVTKVSAKQHNVILHETTL